MKKHVEQAAEFIKGLGLEPSQRQLELLARYTALVLEKSRDFNLTAAADERELWLRHICDGAAAVPLLKKLLADKKAPLIADAGAGAGFSGITAKILWPQAEFVLIDSLSKRCAFMEWACAKLELSAIKAARLRLGQDKSGIQADAVLERAMGQLEDIAGACASVAAPGGYFIAYRSSPQDTGAQLSPLLENAAAPDLPLSYRLPDEEQFRHFAVFRRKALG